MLLIATAASLLLQPGSLELATDRHTDYVIVLRPDASPSERHGAAELSEFLGRMSGAEFPVIETTEPPGKAIIVGSGEPPADLGDEGYILRTEGDRLHIIGSPVRGAMYGCYALLEDVLGCRWWSPGATAVPQADPLIVPRLDERVVPVLEYREPFWTEAFDGLWCVRNRQNSSHASITEDMGGKVQYTGFVHTFYSLVPPAEFFESRPEYFSLIDGERTTDRAQLCLTNPEVVHLVAERVKQWIRDNPGTDIVSVSQNDWHGWCRCESCSEVDEREGSPTGSLIQFVNRVAEIVEEEFPHVAIDTLAYQYTRHPPKSLRPRDNVIIRLCSIECCFSHGLEACPTNEDFERDVLEWSEICDRLYVWNYTTCFPHYLSPFPNLRAIGPDVKFLVDHSVVGIFEQGAYPPGKGEFSALRGWVLAKLLWDPTRDAGALIDEFLAGYYGAAAEPIAEWIDILHDRAEEENIHVGIWVPPTDPHLTDEMIGRGLELFDEALALVEDDPELAGRVREQRLPLEYARIMRWDVPADVTYIVDEDGARVPGGDEYHATIDHFVEVAAERGITEVREGHGTFEPWLESVRARLESAPTVTVEGGGLTAYLLPDHGARVARLIGDDGEERVALPRPGQGDLSSGGIAFAYGTTPVSTAFELVTGSTLLRATPEEGLAVTFGAEARGDDMLLMARIANEGEQPRDIAPRLVCALRPGGPPLRLDPLDGFDRYIDGGNERAAYLTGPVFTLAAGETWTGAVRLDAGDVPTRLRGGDAVRSYCHEWRYHRAPELSGTRIAGGSEMGVAGYLTGDHHEWAIQWPVAEGLLDTGTAYRVRARVRVDGGGDDGGALTAGVHHPDRPEANCQTSLAAREATGDWQTIELGRIQWHDGAYAWLAPTANPENVTGILVDWIEFEEVDQP
ncbi:MAG: DUF4838 domain-containing protein [Armatimonadia bacterium]|nr:DUF4838 domain-containing protein [Armatimonadia bacterium]